MEKIKEIYKKVKTNQLLKTQVIVIVICILLGNLLHFTYKWSGQNAFIGSFSAVNESVWEHLKLVFYPMLIAAIIEYFVVKKIANNYIEAKTIGIFSSISFIVVSFFTYTGIIGTNFFIIDILIIILGEGIAYKLMIRKNESSNRSKILAITIMLFLLICFVVCTYYSPEVNLFRDYSTGTYGISKK